MAKRAATARNRRLEAEQQQIASAIEWLRSKWSDRPCPYCAATEWQVGVPLDIELGGGEMMAPMVPVMCGNCGQLALVNAIVAGEWIK